MRQGQRTSYSIVATSPTGLAHALSKEHRHARPKRLLEAAELSP